MKKMRNSAEMTCPLVVALWFFSEKKVPCMKFSFGTSQGQGWVAIPKFWERARKLVNSQKWLGEGAKGLLSPGSENGVAPVQNGDAPVQKRVLDGAKDSWETFAP